MPSPVHRAAVLRRVPAWGVAATALAILLAPTLAAGSRAFLTIHDNLDGEFVYFVHLARTGTALGSDGVIPQVMGGLPRAALPPGLDVGVALYLWLPPLTAYLVNYAIVHAVALAGMYLLLRHRVRPAVPPPVAAVSALLFALVPFYTIYGLSIAGQPLILAAFLGLLRRENRWYDWAAVLLFPFYSRLVLGGFYIVVALSVLTAAWWWRSRHLPARAVAALLVMTIAYLAKSAALLGTAFGDGGFVSHRVEFRPVVFTGTALGPAVRRGLELLAEGQYHTGQFWSAPIVLIAVITLLRSRSVALVRTAGILAAAIAAIAFWYAVYRPVIVYRLGDVLPQLNYVQLDRFYLLLPTLWFVLFGVAAGELHRSGGRRVPVLIALAGIVLGADLVRRNDELVCSLPGACPQQPRFSEFFAPELFNGVERLIGRPRADFHVASVGLHPSIAQYNGFSTVDGYQNNYPLEYKHAFRKVIAPELEHTPRFRRYFDAWGNRAYLFSEEASDLIAPKTAREPIDSLRIDTSALAALGAEYVVSAAEIRNAPTLRLRRLGSVDHPGSHWRLTVYRIVPSTAPMSLDKPRAAGG